MFDVSMVEVAVIALVALLVLGPEKLPRAARTAGLYLRKARASWYSIRSDIERELAAEDLKRAMKDTERSLLAPPKSHAAPASAPDTGEPPAARDAPPVRD
ncbi:Sec-independent protein translocase protein TatB [Xanthomonadaceae bacterium JHOS43]|nr:Sec-independent protein translocase protein TatB [Xanthomonadaceae bacterium JHOS43]MCX7564115.1 Sec-independent protein translocase protein TatB [Xanthomonadaceae bacterium XH05]